MYIHIYVYILYIIHIFYIKVFYNIRRYKISFLPTYIEYLLYF